MSKNSNTALQQYGEIRQIFPKKVIKHSCNGVVKILEKLSEKLKKIRLKLLKCEKAENSKDKFRILSESQKVTHPNRTSHYITVAEVKKPKKAKSLKSMNKSII